MIDISSKDISSSDIFDNIKPKLRIFQRTKLISGFDPIKHEEIAEKLAGKHIF